MTKTAALKKVFAEVRNSLPSFNSADESIYSFYRWFVRDAAAAGKLTVKTANSADELRASLRVAASTAMQFGATDKQIDMIVSLARGSNNYNVLAGGRLTKADASHIIDSLR